MVCSNKGIVSLPKKGFSILRVLVLDVGTVGTMRVLLPT